MTRLDVIAADGGKCVYCGGAAEQLDHVIPVSRGGPDVFGNLVSACTQCNATKGSGEPLGPVPDRCFVAHPDYWAKVRQCNAFKAAWKLANPELVKEQQRRYAARNKSRRRAYFRAYYLAKKAAAPPDDSASTC